MLTAGLEWGNTPHTQAQTQAKARSKKPVKTVSHQGSCGKVVGRVMQSDKAGNSE